MPIRSDPDEVNRTCDEDKINWGGVSDCFSVNVIRSSSRLCSSRKDAGAFCTLSTAGAAATDAKDPGLMFESGPINCVDNTEIEPVTSSV